MSVSWCPGEGNDSLKERGQTKTAMPSGRPDRTHEALGRACGDGFNRACPDDTAELSPEGSREFAGTELPE